MILVLVGHLVCLERDLFQLVENLKEFVFLSIYGEIHYKKAKAYGQSLNFVSLIVESMLKHQGFVCGFNFLFVTV